MVTRTRKSKVTIVTSAFDEDRSRTEQANEVARRNFVRNTFPRCVWSRAGLGSRQFCAKQTMQNAKEMGLSEDEVRKILTEYDREQVDPENMVCDDLFGAPAFRGRPAIAALLS